MTQKPILHLMKITHDADPETEEREVLQFFEAFAGKKATPEQIAELRAEIAAHPNRSAKKP